MKRHPDRDKLGEREESRGEPAKQQALRRALVQAAWAAGHSKNTFLSALFFRISRRHGMKKACVAVAHRDADYPAIVPNVVCPVRTSPGSSLGLPYPAPRRRTLRPT